MVGGPEASQKGFGDWIPAKLVLRSAMGTLQHIIYLLRRRDTFGGGIDDLRPTVGAVAAGKDSWIVLRHHHASFSLSNRDDDHVARNCFATVGGPHLDPRDRTGSVGDYPLRRGVEAEAAPVALGELVFVVIAGHIGLAAAIHDRGRRRAESLGLRDGVDGGIARPDHHHLASDR